MNRKTFNTGFILGLMNILSLSLQAQEVQMTQYQARDQSGRLWQVSFPTASEIHDDEMLLKTLEENKEQIEISAELWHNKSPEEGGKLSFEQFDHFVKKIKQRKGNITIITTSKMKFEFYYFPEEETYLLTITE